VFRRLNPGAQISYSVIPIGEAFPLGHYEYEGKATEAVRCEIVLADGTYIVAHKEIDKRDRGKDVAQTPEQMAKDETKALGRALRDAGVPQRLTELKELMRWIATMDGAPIPTHFDRTAAFDTKARDVEIKLEEAFPGSVEEVNGDAPDAGSDDPTVELALARKFALLNGADKVAVVKYARDTLGVSNVLRAGDQAEALSEYIDLRGWLNEVVDVPASVLNEPDKKPIYGDEEPF